MNVNCPLSYTLPSHRWAQFHSNITTSHRELGFNLRNRSKSPGSVWSLTKSRRHRPRSKSPPILVSGSKMFDPNKISSGLTHVKSILVEQSILSWLRLCHLQYLCTGQGSLLHLHCLTNSWNHTCQGFGCSIKISTPGNLANVYLN